MQEQFRIRFYVGRRLNQAAINPHGGAPPRKVSARFESEIVPETYLQIIWRPGFRKWRQYFDTYLDISW